MKRLLTSFFLCLCFFVVSQLHVASAENASVPRYATCDVCGYCTDSQDPAQWPTQPAGWAKCEACLYPAAYPNVSGGPTPNAQQGETLLIDEETNLPPTPAEGRHYTVFGCIKTDIGDFTQTGAASSLVQVLLNIIFTAAGGVAILYIIYGSFIIITSQANPEKLAYGKRVVMGSVIGLVLVFSAVLIVNLLANKILTLPGFGSSPPP
jgi:hypothetical protein